MPYRAQSVAIAHKLLSTFLKVFAVLSKLLVNIPSTLLKLFPVVIKALVTLLKVLSIIDEFFPLLLKLALLADKPLALRRVGSTTYFDILRVVVFAFLALYLSARGRRCTR